MTAVQVDNPVPALLSPRTRSARWVPWVLFLVQLVVTAMVIGVLSVVLFVQMTLMPGMIFGEFENIVSWVLGMGLTVAIEVVGALTMFLITGLIVGILGVPVRLIGPLRRWWLGNGEVTIVGVILGVIFIVVAYFFGTGGSLDGVNGSYAFYNPHPEMLITGWLLLAFSLSMLVWPARWMPRRMRRWWTDTQLTKRARDTECDHGGTPLIGAKDDHPAYYRN